MYHANKGVIHLVFIITWQSFIPLWLHQVQNENISMSAGYQNAKTVPQIFRSISSNASVSIFYLPTKQSFFSEWLLPGAGRKVLTAKTLNLKIGLAWSLQPAVAVVGHREHKVKRFLFGRIGLKVDGLLGLFSLGLLPLGLFVFGLFSRRHLPQQRANKTKTHFSVLIDFWLN